MSDDILRKVRGLLAKAERTDNTHEAEAFTAKAESLLQKYAIDRALLAQSDTQRETPVLKVFGFEKGYAKPKTFLLAAIVDAFGGKIIRKGWGDDAGLYVYAFPADLELIDVLYTSLLLQADNAVRRSGGTDRSFRTSFWYGFAGRTSERLKAERSRAVGEATTGTALVLVDRSKEVDAYALAQHEGRVGSYGRGTVGSRAGAQAGSRAADRADIGHTRLGGASKALA